MAEYSCLIVEDSPMMRQLLVFALARVRTLRVTEADDGVDGLGEGRGGQGRRMTRHAFCPPKPKELLKATWTVQGRASFGT